MIELETIYDNAQSFYKKAMIKKEGDKIYLYSYYTLVLKKGMRYNNDRFYTTKNVI